MKAELNCKKNRWLKLWQNLHSVRFEPLPTEKEVNQILACLPERKTAEPLNKWLRRAGVVLPFSGFRFTKLGEIYLKAAASGSENYPIPEQALETPDQSFRLTLRQLDTMLHVCIEALGIAIDDYKGKYIGISASEDPSTIILVTQLDNTGESKVLINDSEFLRKVLCVYPVIGLIELDSE